MIRKGELHCGTTTVCGRHPFAGAGLSLEVVGVIYLLAAVTFGILLVWQPANMANLNRRARELERKVEALKVENEDLKAELARLESLTYVEYVARTKLRMVAPSEVKTAVLVASVSETPGAVQNAPEAKKSSAGITGIVRRIAEIFGGRWAQAGGIR